MNRFRLTLALLLVPMNLGTLLALIVAIFLLKTSGYYVIDNPILNDIEVSYTGTVDIPRGNINKYIVIYFDRDIDVGGLSGTFKFLSNY